MIGTVLDAVAGFGVCGGMLASSYGLHYRLKKGEHEFERERRTLQAQRLDAEARAWIASIPSQAVSEALGDAQGARRADTSWMDIVGVPLDLWYAARPGTDDLAILLARREAGGFKPRLTPPQQLAQARLEADAALIAPTPIEPSYSNAMRILREVERAIAVPPPIISVPQGHVTHSDATYVFGVNSRGEGWQVRRRPTVDTLRCRQDKAIQVELMKQAWKRRYEDDLYEDED